MRLYQKGTHALDGVCTGFVKGFTGLNIPVDLLIAQMLERHGGVDGIANADRFIFTDDGVTGIDDSDTVHSVLPTSLWPQCGTGGLSENLLINGDDGIGSDHPAVGITLGDFVSFGLGKGFDIFGRVC